MAPIPVPWREMEGSVHVEGPLQGGRPSLVIQESDPGLYAPENTGRAGDVLPENPSLCTALRQTCPESDLLLFFNDRVTEL